MIDEKFVGYIRNQLAAGIAKEDIRKALVINGLSEQDIAEGFAAVTPTPSAPGAGLYTPSQPAAVTQTMVVGKSTSLWAKSIPRTNKGFMGIALVLVFGLDLVILISSGFSLMPFWIEMLTVLGVFVFFLLLENYVLSKKFSNTRSALDQWILGLIVARNLIFLLNFIPLIQLLGMMLNIYAAAPFFIVYTILVFYRSKQS